MMTFEDFYNIAEYGNKNWKGNFTPKEIAQNAYDYLCEYKSSIEKGYATHTMVELYKLLMEDINEEEYELLDYYALKLAKDIPALYIADGASDLLQNIDFTNWKYPWLAEITKLMLEYLTLEGLEDAGRASDIPDEILEICEKELKTDDNK